MKTSAHELEHVIQETLEQHAFLLCDSVGPGDLPNLLAGGVEVAVEISGARTGRFSLACAWELAGVLAENLLGLDDPGSTKPEDEEDALMELINIVAGKVLATASPDGLYELGPPSLYRDADGSRWSSLLHGEDVCSILVEDHPALFQVVLT